MVVLAASICTKQGKAILSRQFVEMARSRIEGLLASFPKLIGKNDQHTFVETDSVRYVYQPLDQLYIVLITNKNSNILQDIDTLHLFSRIVSEYCRSSDVKEITRQRFELILVFDEAISLGHRENINLSQIKTISAMESNDERIQAEIQKNKEREAKEEAKRRAQMMDLKKMEARKNARASGFSSDSIPSSAPSYSKYPQSANSPYGGGSSSAPQSLPYQQTTPSQPSYQPMGGKGMQLGKKSTNASLLETIKQDEGIRDLPKPQQIEATLAPSVSRPAAPASFNNPVASQPPPPANQQAIHLTIEEKVSATANRDGGLQNLEVNGVMLLKVNDPESAKIAVQLNLSADANIFKTHPKIDKGAWASNARIALRDTNGAFPVSQPLPVLKWRLSSREESLLPLLVNCWPSPTGTGTCDVTIEFELQQPRFQLSNVSIIIPFTGQVTQPGSAGTGTSQVDYQSSTIVWSVPLISADSASSGVLEFSMNSEDVGVLYPIQVHFTSEKFVELEVSRVEYADASGPVPFSTEYSLVTESYQIA